MQPQCEHVDWKENKQRTTQFARSETTIEQQGMRNEPKEAPAPDLGKMILFIAQSAQILQACFISRPKVQNSRTESESTTGENLTPKTL